MDPADIRTPADLARELTALREQAGLSVRRLAPLTGILPSTLGGYFSGRHSPSVSNLDRLLRACGVADQAALAAWRDALLRLRRRPRRRVADVRPPYRGLASFSDDDEGWLFGRDALVSAVVERVLGADGGDLLVVTGASGSGKSSAVRAGVVPRLRASGLDVLVVTPGERPQRQPDLLVVDQFEEVFAPGADEDALVAALDGVAGVVLVVLRADFSARALAHARLARAMAHPLVAGPLTEDERRQVITGPAARAGIDIEDGLLDLLVRDAAPPGALPLLSHALLATWNAGEGGMTVAAYRATGGVATAVARTAEEACAAIDDGDDRVRHLFLRLVQVSSDAPDTRRRVSRDELADVPVPVIEAFVERRLLVAGTGTVEIAHEALLSAWPRLRSWIDADRAGLVAHRRFADAARAWLATGDDELLPRGSALLAAEERAAEPAHRHELSTVERRFLDAARGQRRRQELSVRRRTRRGRALLAVLAVLVVVAGVLAAVAARQVRVIGDARDVAVSRQLAVRADALRARDPALAAQLAVAAYRIAPTVEARSSVLTASALPPSTRLAGARAVTRSVGVAAGVLVTAGGVAGGAEVWQLGPPPGAAASGASIPPRLVATVPAGPTPATVVAVRDDGRLAAVTGTDGTVTLVDLADPARPVLAGAPLGPAGGAVLALAFAPGGGALAAGTAAGQVRRWDVTDPANPVAAPAVTGSPEAVQGVAWSPDGRSLLAGSADRSGYLWRGGAATPVALTGATGKVFAVAFSPDGSTAALASADRAVHLWAVDPARPVHTADLTGPTNWVNSVGFAPDGRQVVAGSSDGTARIWDVATRQVVTTLPHPGPVTAAAFVGEHALVTAEAGGMPRMWTVPGPLAAGFGDGVFAVGFSADGRTLAAGPGSEDGTASLWDAAAPGGPQRRGSAVDPAGEPHNSGSAALTPDGRTLAVGREDGSVRLFDTTDAAHPVPLGAPLGGGSKLVEQVAISQDGRLLAVSADDSAVRLWDIAVPSAPVLLATLEDATSIVLASAFSRDSSMLAAASADHRTYLYALAEPHAPRQLAAIDGPDSYAYSPAWSPDGRTLAVGSADRSVRLYNVGDPVHPTLLGPPLTGPANYVYAVAWSPDGATLAAASTDATVRLWDVRDVRAPAPLATLTGPTDAVFAVAWSPDGQTLAAGSADRTVRLYTADPERAATAICARAGSRVSAAEWAQYVPDLPYTPPC